MLSKQGQYGFSSMAKDHIIFGEGFQDKNNTKQIPLNLSLQMFHKIILLDPREEQRKICPGFVT